MIVGLTGGFASGKSLVAGELRRLGALIIDADQIAREVASPGGEAYDEVVKEFGPGVVKPDGTLDRKAIAEVVFSDKAALSRLNSITHPRIRERIREEAERLDAGGDSIVVLDIALLIETGVKYEVEKIIVVYADRDQQIDRAMRRDGISREQAEKRLSSQMDIKEKLRYADYVVDNSGTTDGALEQTRQIYEKLVALKNVKKGT